MIRAKKVYFKTTYSNLQRLFECNRESAKVWNHCLETAKNYSLSNSGKWINKTELQKETKGKYKLHSQSIQAICHKYLFSRDSTHKGLRKGIKTARYPYKKKNHFNTKWVDQAFVLHENGKIELSLGIYEKKRQVPIVVYVNPSTLPKGSIKEIELCYDNGLYFAISFEDGQEIPSLQNKNAVGVDLGEIHSIAAFCETGAALIVTGRKVRSIHQLRNKKLAQLQRLMSKCKKGSRQWKKYNKAKSYIISKSNKQLQDALHKTTKQFVQWCIEKEAQEVFVGNPEGVQRNTKKKRAKKTNQKLSNWSFGTLKKYIEYKLQVQGMVCKFVSEEYTSQTCPCCDKRKKVNNRNYKCDCGYQEHRDVHGARNILSKALHGKIINLESKTQLKYLRIA